MNCYRQVRALFVGAGVGASVLYLQTASAGDAPVEAAIQSNATPADVSPIVPPVKRAAPRMPNTKAKSGAGPNAARSAPIAKPKKKTGS